MTSINKPEKNNGLDLTTIANKMTYSPSLMDSHIKDYMNTLSSVQNDALKTGLFQNEALKTWLSQNEALRVRAIQDEALKFSTANLANQNCVNMDSADMEALRDAMPEPKQAYNIINGDNNNIVSNSDNATNFNNSTTIDNNVPEEYTKLVEDILKDIKDNKIPKEKISDKVLNFLSKVLGATASSMSIKLIANFIMALIKK